jgi:hypothetical protein
VIHPDTELRIVSSDVGYGVFATAEIPRGSIVWALDPFDRAIDPAAVEALPAPLRRAVRRGSYLDPLGRMVFCRDHGRYVNHACRPNCRELGTSFEIADRTIHAGEELTCDYGAIGVLIPFDCRCGETDCRGRIEVSAEPPPHPGHDESLLELWELAPKVAQPLLAFAAPDPADAEMLATLKRRCARYFERTGLRSAGRRRSAQ